MYTSTRHRHPAPRRMFRMMVGMFENHKETWDKLLHEIKQRERRVREEFVGASEEAANSRRSGEALEGG